jgi:hypothetical protein
MLTIDDIAALLESSYAAGERFGRASCLRNELLRALWRTMRQPARHAGALARAPWTPPPGDAQRPRRCDLRAAPPLADGLLTLRWTEKGGPPVKAPARHGFGGRVIERMIGGLKGKAHFDWRPEGIVREIIIQTGAELTSSAPDPSRLDL